jgi:hypothetical protein
MDKDEERRHLELLRTALPDFPNGPIDGTGENPDFVIDAGSSRIGVELTRLFHHGAAAVARESDQASIVLRAQAIATSKHCPPLLVFVQFRPDSVIGKKRVQPLAEELAREVAANMPAVGETAHTSRLPPEVWEIRIARPRPTFTANWQASRVGIVPLDFRLALQNSLDTKRDRLSSYLKRCDECWLVVVAPGTSPSAFVEIDGPTREALFDFAFARCFMLDGFNGRYFELQRRTA